MEGALREIDHAFGVLKADGVVMMTNVNDQWLGDVAFAPVFEELNRRKAIVYVHPTVATCCRNLVPDVPGSMIEFGTDTTRTIASLLFSGTSARCPNVRFLFSHAGGTMPYITERFTRLAMRPDLAAKLPKGVMHELKRFFFDTAQAAHPMALNSLRELVAVSQIIFGTDYPYRTATETAKGIAGCGFSAAQMKGSGWYATDFKNSGSKPAEKSGDAGKSGKAATGGDSVKTDSAKSDGGSDSGAKTADTSAASSTPAKSDSGSGSGSGSGSETKAGSGGGTSTGSVTPA